ncbi:hypothetical protein [Paracoccus zhejiangensis]|uniref:Uncharacterized protein n=1 Tax=Paracoccus zhejiangensis TaxID=1077935 RepID=A0A2H5EZT1_9RHOB|nr:hypothetical protein [Paracoccus zhejiangensis]AUH64809.1 hypothetical protein CX676_12050 [Paracoccus zhejiangensis]
MGREFGLIGQHVRLSLSLFLRHGAVLSAIWAAGALLDQVLLRLAVEIGFVDRLLGLLAIAPVILLQLLIAVSMFLILRDGLPRLRLRRRIAAASLPAPATDTTPEGGVFAAALLAVLIPFYGYYAGWGFLGDTLRSYSQIFYTAQMARVDFTQPELPPTALEVSQTGWVILAVLLIWAIRRMAKAMQGRSKVGFWPMLVVACEATWALLGLYIIGSWKNELAGWLATLPKPGELLQQIIPAASAAISDAVLRPVDWAPGFQLWPMLKSLFWYGLLPLVWFNLGAIVYGHDLHGADAQTLRVAGRAIDRWKALPKPVTDFIGHFWMGVVKRWNAVMNGVLLAASAGFALTASVLVLWRLVDWLGNWAWVGIARLIGPQDMLTWQVLSVPLNALFNAPGAPAGGLLVSPLQFCILAAGLELALRSQARPADAAPA